MNRIIKFRAWHKERKEMFSVVSICFSDLNGREKKAELNNGYITIWPPVNEVELMQFTGLHDKNGKEIYEVDIVEFGMLRYLIKFEDGGCRLFLKNENFGILEKQYAADFNIIGNIYENPEFLEAAK